MTRALRAQRTVGLALALLLAAATAAAFAYVQYLKTRPSALVWQKVGFIGGRFAPDVFSPICECKRSEFPVAFRLRRESEIDVAVVNAKTKEQVAVLLPRARRKGQVVVKWDGRTSSGQLAPEGTYQIRIGIRGERRRIELPRVFRIDTTPPKVGMRLERNGVFTPGAAGPNGSFAIRLTADEPVTMRAAVYEITEEGPKRITWLGRVRPVTRKLVYWRGHDARNRPVAPGVYLIGYRATDLGGNTVEEPLRFGPSDLGQAGYVRVRQVELTPAGDVLTGYAEAQLERQRVGPKDASRQVRKGPPEKLRFKRPPQRGFYTLRAEANGREAWAYQAAPGTAAAVVVVPSYTWQFANPYDGNGDGLADVAPESQSLARPLVDGERQIANLIDDLAAFRAWQPNFGAATDRFIEDNGIPATVRLLVIAGQRAYTAGFVRRVNAFEARGGNVLVLGPWPDRPAVRTPDAISVRPIHAKMPISRKRVYRRVLPAVRTLSKPRTADSKRPRRDV